MKRLYNWYLRLIERVFDEKPRMTGFLSNTENKVKALILLPPLIILFGIILWLAIFFSNIESHYIKFMKRINNNEIIVSCDNGIDCNEVRIEWEYSMFRPKTIFEKNKQLDENFNEVGESTFLVYYKDKLEARINQYKRKDWLKHKYVFHIELDTAKNITVETNIIGDFKAFKQTNY